MAPGTVLVPEWGSLDALTYSRTLSQLAPVPCRDDFAKMAQTHFVSTGRAAEIGVYRGDFAARGT